MQAVEFVETVALPILEGYKLPDRTAEISSTHQKNGSKSRSFAVRHLPLQGEHHLLGVFQILDGDVLETP